MLQLQLVSLCHTIQFKYADWVRKFGCSSTRAELNRAGNQLEMELELELDGKGIKANVHVQLWEQEQEQSPGCCVSLIGFGFGFLVIAFLAPHCGSRQCCPPPHTPLAVTAAIVF